MHDTGFHIAVIIVAALGLVIGFKKGILRQLGGVLGFVFGIVFSRLFSDNASGVVGSVFPSLADKFYGGFICSIVGSAVVFVVVYMLFTMMSGVLSKVLSTIGIGALNSIAGAAFCTLKYLFLLSLVFNLILCVSPRSALMRCCEADDGNLVECVAAFAPALLGSESFGELAYRMHLKDAEKISYNYRPVRVVTYTGVESLCNANLCVMPGKCLNVKFID